MHANLGKRKKGAVKTIQAWRGSKDLPQKEEMAGVSCVQHWRGDRCRCATCVSQARRRRPEALRRQVSHRAGYVGFQRVTASSRSADGWRSASHPFACLESSSEIIRVIVNPLAIIVTS